MNITLLWLVSAALIVLGLAATVLPGMVLGAWTDEFTRLGVATVVVVSVLAVLAWGLDYAARLMGARPAARASRRGWARRWAVKFKKLFLAW